MAEEDDDTAARAQFAVHNVFAFDRHAGGDIIERHRPHFCAREQIGAEPLEMLSRQTAQFALVIFRSPNARREIVLREPAILAGEQATPARPQNFAERKKRTRSGSSRISADARAIQKVNAEIEHAGAAERPAGGRAA